MSPDLRDALDDLARGGVRDVDLHRLAARSRSRAHRRRQRRVTTVAGAVGAVLVLVALLAPGLTGVRRSLPADTGRTVDGHPERIGWQWPVRDLPDRPGPMAALVDTGHGWDAVRSDGHRWHIPMERKAVTWPTLSPDGRLLGYVQSDGRTYLVRDLVSGQRRLWPGLGAGISGPGLPPPTRWAVGGQAPSFFSPDGRHLAVNGFRGDVKDGETSGPLLLDVVRGGLVDLRAGGFLAGWLPDSSAVATVEQVTKELPNPDPRIVTGQTVLAAVRVHVVSTTGAELRTVTLRPSQRSWDPTGRLSQRSWALSPGGDRLLVVEEAAGAAFLRTFALADGREVREPISVLGLWTPCGVSWVSGAKVSVPVLQPGEPPSRQIVDLGSGEAQTATVVAPRLHAQCVEVLGAALAGPGKGGGLLGTSTAGWTWWWRELTLGLLAAGAVAALLVRWVVRRRRLRQDESTQLDWFG